jgi:hypothetical protein
LAKDAVGEGGVGQFPWHSDASLVLVQRRKVVLEQAVDEDVATTDFAQKNALSGTVEDKVGKESAPATRNDAPGPPRASLSASQAYGGFPAKHFLTSLNLDLIVIKAGVVVCASLEWRGAPGWHGVQVCIGEVCSNDIAGCVV